MNGKMRVELGIWPIFAFLFGAPAVAATATTAAVAATTGFLTYAGVTGVALLTANSIISMFDRPETNVTEIPGSLAMREFSPQIAQILQQQAEELKKLHEEELKQEEEEKSLEEQKAQQEKLKEAIAKYGPLVLIGSVGLLIVLLKKRKKR